MEKCIIQSAENFKGEADLSVFGEINGQELTCSLHGWRFDLNDGHCLNAENRPLRVRRRPEAVFRALLNIPCNDWVRGSDFVWGGILDVRHAGSVDAVDEAVHTAVLPWMKALSPKWAQQRLAMQ